ncbi:NAD(P)H-binding protein [Escherichia coli]|nr:NAD(P)H-binding protein [Escherichia coli]
MGHQPVTLVRNRRKIKLLPRGTDIFYGDVSIPETLTDLPKDIDAIIFTLGSDGQGRIGARAIDYGGVRNILRIFMDTPVRIALMTTIGVTERLSSWNQRTEVHDWKRRSERLVRASGHIYTFPLTTNTNVLDIGDKTPMPLPLKLYITPVGAAGGVVIKAGEVIARIHMYKIATLGSGNPRNFTWNIISNNSVVMPTGGCTVDSRNVTVNLPDFPGSAEIPLGVYCSSEQKLSFYLSGATTDSARQVFANAAPDATKASGVGVSLIRNGKILATGENVSLGTVNKSKVPLGLSATYGQTGNKVAAGAVQSVIGVTFIYE